MIIIPAIDIKNGKVVRLSQGKFDEVTVYGEDPVAMAKKWEKAGAPLLHVVDLDGAQKGTMKNFDLIAQIAKSVRVPVQVGGGIQEKDEIAKLFSSGISRVILGTKAIENRKFLKEILNKWREKIVVSMDCSNGLVTQEGWTKTTELKATEFAEELEGCGLNTLIYTDITRDGTLSGPNFDSLKKVLDAVEMQVISSGGVSQLDDITKLMKLEPYGLEGVIVGKAIYENKLDLKEAIKVCSPKG